MATLQFKTNINCNNCVRTVTHFLNATPQVTSWQVDINNPDKLLTVEGEATVEEVVAAVAEAGFTATAV